MNLNFKISEFTASQTAVQFKINNMPDINSLDCLLDLIFFVMQPLRDKLGKPIIISSGYRCYELNQKVGGVATSQHIMGQACDFTVPGMTVQQVFDFVQKSGIEYDQLIHEGNWVHISFVRGKNRRQAFKA